mmetsp:Transcript_7776/g.11230  ORF Transcript_7776/g.11230 Transcript_7776/m.11230 type:complete len:91 (+) Transcript_7776:43-315(+)
MHDAAADSKNVLHTLYDAEAAVYGYKQGKNTSNNEYYKKFKDNVTTVERLGVKIGVQDGRVNEIVNEISVNPGSPTEAETARAKRIAKDR